MINLFKKLPSFTSLIMIPAVAFCFLSLNLMGANICEVGTKTNIRWLDQKLKGKGIGLMNGPECTRWCLAGSHCDGEKTQAFFQNLCFEEFLQCLKRTEKHTNACNECNKAAD